MIDMIEFYHHCWTETFENCNSDICKYSWYCTTIKFASRFTTMIYSEGE